MFCEVFSYERTRNDELATIDKAAENGGKVTGRLIVFGQPLLYCCRVLQISLEHLNVLQTLEQDQPRQLLDLPRLPNDDPIQGESSQFKEPLGTMTLQLIVVGGGGGDVSAGVIVVGGGEYPLQNRTGICRKTLVDFRQALL